jgi:hypothetical protein
VQRYNYLCECDKMSDEELTLFLNRAKHIRSRAVVSFYCDLGNVRTTVLEKKTLLKKIREFSANKFKQKNLKQTNC